MMNMNTNTKQMDNAEHKEKYILIDKNILTVMFEVNLKHKEGYEVVSHADDGEGNISVIMERQD